ncbi:hypothetical protein ACC710_37225, partial [Rhizobium ruizarguesonis]
CNNEWFEARVGRQCRRRSVRKDIKGSAGDVSSLPIPITAMRPAALEHDAGADEKLETASIGPIDVLPDRTAPALPAYARFEPL